MIPCPSVTPLPCLCVCLQLKRGELETVEAECDIESKTLGSLEADAAVLQHSINATLYEKQRGLERLASIQVRVCASCPKLTLSCLMFCFRPSAPSTGTMP